MAGWSKKSLDCINTKENSWRKMVKHFMYGVRLNFDYNRGKYLENTTMIQYVL